MGSEGDAAFLGLVYHLFAGNEVDFEAAVLIAVVHGVVGKERHIIPHCIREEIFRVGTGIVKPIENGVDTIFSECIAIRRRTGIIRMHHQHYAIHIRILKISADRSQIISG